MKLEPRELSESDLKRINNRWQKGISKHLKEIHIKAISGNLEIAEEPAKDIILESLVRLGWRCDDLGEPRIFWLSLLKLCTKEKKPLDRWEKAKSLICEFIIKRFNSDLVYGAYEIIWDSRIPYDAVPMREGFIKKLFYPSFVEYCLRMVMLFNVKNFDVPSEVFIGWGGRPNFCEWRFRRKGTLLEITLRDGDKKERFIPKLQVTDIWEFEDLYTSSCVVLENNAGNFVEVELKNLLEDCGLAGNPVPGTYKNLIALIFKYASLGMIKKHLRDSTGKNLGSQQEIEKELESGYSRARINAFAKIHFPELDCVCTGHKATQYPEWDSNNWLLNLQKLKIDLGELYLSRLSKEDREKALFKLVNAFGFDPFNYESFRNIINEWRREGDYKNIRSVLDSLNERYALSDMKKWQTKRDWALLCLRVIKERLETGANHRDASKAVAGKFKDRKLSLRARSTSDVSSAAEQIRIRTGGIMTEESKNYRGKINTIMHFKYLYSRLMDKYYFQESEI